MKAITKQQLGRRLAEFRKRAGYTQTNAAARVGVATETLSRLERGEQWTDFETLAALADLYGTDWSDLMAVIPEGQNSKRKAIGGIIDLLGHASLAEIDMVHALAEVVVQRRRRTRKS